MSSSHTASCPCKRVPLYLSSFTAAEHGDLHSLVFTSTRSSQPWIASRVDSAGSTPLHYSAQHGHVAATAFLLQQGSDVNAAASGATPLHRASFSGATSTMRLLLEDQNCYLLVPDTSFGDRMTPLHKAASGGRYLAVQLLLDVLRTRKLLETALTITDSMGMTPLQVAQAKMDREEEPQSVARWNTVAGGSPSWNQCAALLRNAQSSAGLTSIMTTTSPRRILGEKGCLDCQGGICVTGTWEAAFERALTISTGKALEAVARSAMSDKPQIPHNDDLEIKLMDELVEEGKFVQHSRAVGVVCARCGNRTVALYRREGERVCKACRRNR